MATRGIKFGAQLQAKTTREELDLFIENAARIGSTKDIVLRELVRAFNEACRGERRPVFPLKIASPMYRVIGDAVIDANGATTLAAEAGADYGAQPGDVMSKTVAAVLTELLRREVEKHPPVPFAHKPSPTPPKH